MIDDQDLDRYSRQILVSGFEFEGQERLSRARLSIVGCGGLGSVVASYLGAAGVGFLRLVDDDVVSLSNLPRQVAYSERDIGKPKAEALASRLLANNPGITVEPQCARLDEVSASTFCADVDLVVDATDNRTARLLIDQATYRCHLPWLMGAAVQASGQNVAFDARRTHGCYHCLSPNDTADTGSCATLGILGPVVGAVALSQAMDALRILTGCGPVPWGEVRIRDFRSDEQQVLRLHKNPHCSNCGD